MSTGYTQGKAAVWKGEAAFPCSGIREKAQAGNYPRVIPVFCCRSDSNPGWVLRLTGEEATPSIMLGGVEFDQHFLQKE